MEEQQQPAVTCIHKFIDWEKHTPKKGGRKIADNNEKSLADEINNYKRVYGRRDKKNESILLKL
jgi:hypothetical protein